MKLENIPFSTVSWDAEAVFEVPGESGAAKIRSVQIGEIRLRMVEYSPKYVANHWCSKGHTVLLLSGSLTVILQDGRAIECGAGNSFNIGDDDWQHRVTTETGTIAFIID